MPGCISNEILQNVPNYTQFNSTRYTKLYKSYNFQMKHLELINLSFQTWDGGQHKDEAEDTTW